VNVKVLQAQGLSVIGWRYSSSVVRQAHHERNTPPVRPEPFEGSHWRETIERSWLQATTRSVLGPHKDRIWLRSRSGEQREWMDLDELADEFLPDLWRTYGDLAASSGHGGGDLLEIIDFVEAISRGVEPEIGIHQTMDMTLPGLVSQQSIAKCGRWLDVPDSRD